MGKIFLISDTHFGHGNIIEYCHRPFSTIEEMNEELVRRWNDVVGKDDTVYFLGDFALGAKENIFNYGVRLNGHKHLIIGNHDRQKQLYLDAGFETVSKTCFIPLNNGKTLGIYLTHQPWHGVENKCVNIHGHIHDNVLDDTFDKAKHFNVSADNIEFTPIELQEIIKRMGW